ncbi:MAG: sugar transferase [Candidatus Margulisiibacteriota bacterium]
MKKRSTLIIILLLAADIFFLAVSFIFGYYVKYGPPWVSGVYPLFLLERYSRNLLFAVFATISVFNFFSLYSKNQNRDAVDEAASVAGAVTVSSLIFFIISLIYREIVISRRVIFAAWGLSIILIAAFRIIVIRIRRWLFLKGVGVAKVLIIGDPAQKAGLVKRITEHPEMGLRIVGQMDYIQERIDQQFYSKLRETLSFGRVDRIIFACSLADSTAVMKLIEVCEVSRAEFQFVPRVLDIIESRISSDEIVGVPLITVKEIKLYGLNALLKRTFDLAASFLAVLLFAPIFAVIAVLIKLDSKGAVFFMQKRVGENGKEFHLFKFRSMVEGADAQKSLMADRNEADGPIFKMRRDPRVTRIGGLLRRFSLDELPQIFNVLLGQMSLVGPRPPLPQEVKEYNEWHWKRLRVLAGMTGLWQVSGRSELSFEEMVKLDIYYIENWSLWLDIKILLKTIPVVLSSKGAY